MSYPHGAAAPVVSELRARGVRVVDLSADFRLQEPAEHERWYGVHGAPELVAEAERMKRMLGRLRALAHADEDVPLRRELVDLAELTADVVRAYTAQAATTGVGLVTQVSVQASINADKDLLREAVANLVDNALRVSPPGTQVRLSVDRGSSGPLITVADNGPGIEEDRLPRLFERFQRSDSGSGLGLAIARRVVERHGGTIRVKTEPGAGSTFTIELPY